jgi:Domain of unknown function (DUF3601)
MKHYNQSNLAEIFNKDFKAEKLNIGGIALNAHYTTIQLPEIVDIYIIDADTENDTFAERLEKLTTHNGWVHLAAGLSLFVENQHITIIQIGKKYIEPVAHFSQKDVLKILGKPENKLNDNCDSIYDSYSSGCYIWYYNSLKIFIYFEGKNKKIEEIHFGKSNDSLEVKKPINSKNDLSFWKIFKIFFTDKKEKKQIAKLIPAITTSVYELKQGKSYRVIKEFIDYDHQVHPVGETWFFDRTDYVPYHSGLSLFVIENGSGTQYRFQDVEEEQAELLRTFMNYVVLVD